MSEKYQCLEAKASYGVGLNMGSQLYGQPFDGLDVDAVCDGLRDAFNQAEHAVSHEEIDLAFKHVNNVLQTKKMEQSKEVIAAGDAFFKKNGAKEGVVTTESGLQYEVLVAGAPGEKPSLTSKVKTHYHGTLLDGTVFDSSVVRGEPIEFPVNGVIRGWTEALQMMDVGSKWRLVIPHNLAYGEKGAGTAIGPFSTLVFEVELLEITE